MSAIVVVYAQKETYMFKFWVSHLKKEKNTFNQQGCIKVIKSNSKDNNGTRIRFIL